MIKRVLYLGWLGRANVGDEVLYSIFKRGLLEACESANRPFSLEIDAWQSHKHYEQSVHYYDLVVLGGGSIFHIGHWLSICAEAQKQGVTTIAWGTGVDSLEKNAIHYLPPANREFVTRVASKMAYVSCRGALTKNWLQQHVAGQQINILGDPALNYLPPTNDQPKRTNTVYVNWGTSNGQIYGGDEKRLEQQLVKAIRALCEKGLEFVIVALWVDDLAACKKLAATINHKNVQLIPNVLAADRLFGVLQQCRVAISLKLHGAILAAAAGCLPISLAYRFKCIEFMESIGFSDYCLTTDAVSAEDIVSAVGRLLSDDEKNKKVLETAKASYTGRLSQSYIDTLNLL